MFLNIIGVIGGSATLIGVATWLSALLTKHFLIKDIEKYKQSLRTESDKEIEELKIRLQLASKEREIAVNWLHEKRAYRIEQLYSSLIDVQSNAYILLNSIGTQKNA